jgi:hypothetical protein
MRCLPAVRLSSTGAATVWVADRDPLQRTRRTLTVACGLTSTPEGASAAAHIVVLDFVLPMD